MVHELEAYNHEHVGPWFSVELMRFLQRAFGMGGGYDRAFVHFADRKGQNLLNVIKPETTLWSPSAMSRYLDG
jgi:hypothetical protein